MTKRHSGDPVPFVMAGPGIAANNGRRLTENEAKQAGLLIDPGYLLLERFLR
jgi:2,3-bisphosphoglycerate-independent phosphoglycerate mutase